MAEDKNYTNNKERPREDEELEIDLMEYVRKLWAARKMLLKVAGIGAIVCSTNMGYGRRLSRWRSPSCRKYLWG